MKSPITIKLEIDCPLDQYQVSEMLRGDYVLLQDALSAIIQGILLEKTTVKVANQCSAYDEDFVADICVDFSR
jgi:hypothetical protein